MQNTKAKPKSEQEPETDEQLLERYREHALNREHSEGSIAQYLKSCRMFLDFMVERHGPGDRHLASADQDDVEAWTSHMRKHGLNSKGEGVGNSPNTRRIRLCGLKAVTGHAGLPVADTISIPKRDMSRTEDLKRSVLDADEYAHLRDMVTETYRHHRAHDHQERVRGPLVAMLLLETAMRESEVADLDVGDVYLEPVYQHPSVSIHGKGSRQRTMRISPGLYNALVGYRDTMRPRDASTVALLVSRNGGRLSGETIRDVIYRYTEKFVGRRMGPHQLRRSTITQWQREGHNPEVIRQWAGHQSVATTYMSYIGATPRDMAAAEDARLNGGTGSMNGNNGPDLALRAKLDLIEQARNAGILNDEEARNRVDRLLGLSGE